MREVKPTVIRGGVSNLAREKSIKSGGFILDNLKETYENVYDVLIDEDGWHYNGQRVNPQKFLDRSDLVFINLLSQINNRDSNIGKRIEQHRRPFVGAPTFPSLVSNNKHLSKEFFLGLGIRTPKYEVLGVVTDLEREAMEIFRSFTLPVIVKPSRSENSRGLKIARSFNDLLEGISCAYEYSNKVLIEEYIRGREISCALIEGFRGEDIYALPLGEIIPDRKTNNGGAEKNVNKFNTFFPARVKKEERSIIHSYTKNAHSSLGLRHFSRADLIIGSKGEIYLLEINSSPYLNKDSLMHQHLNEGGLGMEKFLRHQINLAIAGK